MGLLTAFLLLLRSSSPVASAQSAKAVMEGISTSAGTVLISTRNGGRLYVATTSYSGAVSNVGLYVGSNVVVGSVSQRDACVIYSSGSVTCKGVTLSTGSLAHNASLIGGTSATDLLGVNSASAAVKNASNFVLNSEIDPSSVAKLSGGLIPNYLLDGSSIAKLSAGSIPPILVGLSTVTTALNAKLSSVTINASLLNPQASASLPLGVDSASGVIKSAGLIRNSEIDPSSITKLAADGFVPDYLVDPSSIAKLSGGLLPKWLNDPSSVTMRIGISSACNAGEYVSSATYANGVLMGGGCVTAGGGSSAFVSTKTVNITQASDSNNTMSKCIAASSVTLACSGTKNIEICPNMMMDSASSNINIGFNVLMSSNSSTGGQFIPPFDNTVMRWSAFVQGGNQGYLLSGCQQVACTAAATFTFCIAPRGSSSTTWTIYKGANNGNEFQVHEVPW